jgi:hypothetical protein
MSRTLRPDGYYVLYKDGKLIMEHVHLCELAIGRKLKGAEEVHHVNEVRSDNTSTNLVVCPNHRYHELLHLRTKALVACGNAGYRICKFCGQYDDPSRMYLNHHVYYHRECRNRHQRAYRNRLKENASCQLPL